LKTLEEIGEEGKENFLESGGDSFSLIDCLIESFLWVDTIISLIQDSSLHNKAGVNDLSVNFVFNFCLILFFDSLI
jgi:hypothetical protein